MYYYIEHNRIHSYIGVVRNVHYIEHNRIHSYIGVVRNVLLHRAQPDTFLYWSSA